MMDRPDITAVILAAGYSSRMGCFKPLLKIGEQTFLERAVSLFRDTGIRDIRVVVGDRRERIEPILEKAGIQTIVNAANSREMFSSVLAALHELEPVVRSIMLLPVDIPLVRSWTIRYLLQKHYLGRDRILIPCFQGKRGHPVIIPANHFSVIKQWTGKDGLRGAFSRLADKTTSVPVADAGILFDVDTPHDYEALKKRWLNNAVPTREECEAILKDVVCVEERIYAHGLAVSRVAEKICNALVRSGGLLDCNQVIAAGLLHDLAKGNPRHDQKAAEMLTEMGYAGIAPIVAAHTDIACSPDEPVNPSEVLYLADKMVSGTAIVSLKRRFHEALQTYGHDPEIRKKIEKRFQNALLIREKIEAVLGEPLSGYMNTG